MLQHDAKNQWSAVKEEQKLKLKLLTLHVCVHWRPECTIVCYMAQHLHTTIQFHISTTTYTCTPVYLHFKRCKPEFSMDHIPLLLPQKHSAIANIHVYCRNNTNNWINHTVLIKPSPKRLAKYIQTNIQYNEILWQGYWLGGIGKLAENHKT